MVAIVLPTNWVGFHLTLVAFTLPRLRKSLVGLLRQSAMLANPRTSNKVQRRAHQLCFYTVRLTPILAMYKVSLRGKTCKLCEYTLSILSYFEQAYLGIGSRHQSLTKCNRELLNGAFTQCLYCFRDFFKCGLYPMLALQEGENSRELTEVADIKEHTTL